LREGVSEDIIYVTGNTVIDAMLHTVKENYVFEQEELNKIDYKNKKVIMITAHRRENWGEGIDNICTALNRIVEENENVELVYLVHLNPIVKDVVFEKLGGNPRIHLLPPQDTQETHNLMNKCFMVMTDSGGLQEEAPHLGKPVLVLRDVTERPEAVKYGTVKLVGTNVEKIVSEANKLINDSKAYENMSKAINPYGDGKASERIADAILRYFELSDKEVEEFNR
ncbi:MAG: UDP-N-acetylglucosamine 2-epimerase (non-hydrolyzing), partial [Clostridium sp.]|nr:UDP-N-acetylglucosamine 2-epimerase (non-hydrolyzing) [Clostridium sp.]